MFSPLKFSLVARSFPHPSSAIVTVLLKLTLLSSGGDSLSLSQQLSMATEEVSKPPSLPPYPEMIFSAIDSLKDKDGLSKSSITKFMESTYGDLPAGHTNLLSDHLNKLKESGELIIIKNNYMRPDPNATEKRGRGRPPKPKDPSLPEANTGPTRPRGRPRKDPNAPPAPKKARPAGTSSGGPMVSKTGKPRGRPRKVKPELAQNEVEAS